MLSPSKHGHRGGLRALLAATCIALAAGCSTSDEMAKLAATGNVRELRHGADHVAARGKRHPPLLILGIDGMKRDVLYELLDSGQLPGLESLLGGRGSGGLQHAYLDR